MKTFEWRRVCGVLCEMKMKFVYVMHIIFTSFMMRGCTSRSAGKLENVR